MTQSADKSVDIHAWIVVVEKYAGQDLDIPAPIGTWALELADVLLRRDPKTQIVFSSALAERQDYPVRMSGLKERGVQFTHATRSDLEKAMNRLHGDGTLLLYWVGHGVMHRERDERFLLCYDSAQPGDLNAFSVDELRKMLRSGAFPSLQLGFFDCCAQLIDGTPRFLKCGPAEAATRQFFYYASSRDVLVAADVARQGFSSVVINALRNTRGCPIEPGPLFLTIQKQLKDLQTKPFFVQWIEDPADRWSQDTVGSPGLSKIQKTAVRQLMRATCGSILFLNGESLRMEDAFCQPIFREPRRRSETEFVIQSQTEIERGKAGVRSTMLSRGDLSGQRDLPQWPSVDLDDRLRALCGTGQSEDRRPLLLVDDPGGGKTTTLRNIIWRVATPENRGNEIFREEARTPVFVALREWTKQSPMKPLEVFLANSYSNRALQSADQWLYELDNGGLFLAFDALDELGPDSPVVNYLSKQMPEWIRANNCVIVSCRFASGLAYSELWNSSERLQLDGIGPKERGTFIQKYPADFDRNDLINGITHDDVLEKLASSPFLLDVLCYLASDPTGQLPKTRNEIIANAITKILKSGRHDFTKGAPEHHSGLPEVEVLGRVLARTALRLMLREVKDRSFFSANEFKTALREATFFEGIDPVPVNLLFQFFVSTRLFHHLPTQEALSDRPGEFAHQLFFELLVSQGVARHLEADANVPIQKGHEETPSSLIHEGVYDPAWIEVLTLLPSQLENPKLFFDILFEKPDDLTRSRMNLALRAFNELPQRLKDRHPDEGEFIGRTCLEIVTAHWRTGTGDLVRGLTKNASSIAAVFPESVERLLSDLRSPRLEARQQAWEWLAHIGSPDRTVPELVGEEGLRHQDGYIRKLAGSALTQSGVLGVQSLIDILDDERWQVKISACEALAEYGLTRGLSDHVELIPKLLRLTSDEIPLLSAAACGVLGLLGEAAKSYPTIITRLVELSSDAARSLTIRVHAAQALGRLGPIAAEDFFALAALVKSLSAKDGLLRAASVEALASLAPHMKERRVHVLNEIVAFLQLNTDADSCATACDLLCRMALQTDAEILGDQVQALLTHQDVGVQVRASEALGQLGLWSRTSASFDVLMAGLKDKTWDVRSRTITAVKKLASHIVADEARVQQLVDQLETKYSDPACESAAVSTCKALGALGKDLKQKSFVLVHNSLAACLSSKMPAILRAAALDAYAQLPTNGYLSRPIIENLHDCLDKKQEWYLRTAACKSLASGLRLADDDFSSMVSAVHRCVASQEWCVRVSACEALGQLWDHSDKSRSTEALVALISDPQEPVREKATAVLMRIMQRNKTRLILERETETFRVESRDGVTLSELKLPPRFPAYL